MPIKKTITDRVIAANRANAAKSTGPVNAKTTRFNAIKSGILTAKLVFKTKEDEERFNLLYADVILYYRPVGPIEIELAAEIAICFWRMQLISGWEFAEFNKRQNLAAAILDRVKATEGSWDLPLSATAADGWEPQELFLRTGNLIRDKEPALTEGQATEQIVIGARMTTVFDRILRYGAAIRRDLYRAISTLAALQRERLENGQLPAKMEVADEQE